MSRSRDAVRYHLATAGLPADHMIWYAAKREVMTCSGCLRLLKLPMSFAYVMRETDGATAVVCEDCVFILRERAERMREAS